MSAESPGDTQGRPAGSGASGTGASGTGGSGTGAPAQPTGPALARAALDAALTKRRAAAARPSVHRDDETDDADPHRRRGRRGYTGAGPDPRDPQPFAAVLGRLVKARGWQRPAAEATVFGEWARVVGDDVAGHCRPVKLEHGELTVEAESTAWATQLRMLATKLLARIAREVGPNVVTKLHIHGPAAPSWNRGPRRVRGRGPRDTYG
ncbi:MAG TPA: DciA family protein [Micromonosporaceae bacterium]|nr:DciA family protein [Micromonosporaceae bacterium]